MIKSQQSKYKSYLIDHLGESSIFRYSGDVNELIFQVTSYLPERIVTSLPAKYRMLHDSFLTPKDHDRLYLLNYLLADHYGIEIMSSMFRERMKDLVNNYIILTILDKVKDGEITPEDGSILIPSGDEVSKVKFVGSLLEDRAISRARYLDMLYRRYSVYGEYVSQTIRLCYGPQQKEVGLGMAANRADQTRKRQIGRKDQNVQKRKMDQNTQLYQEDIVDSSEISTASTIWLIIQQLSDDLTDWEEDQSKGSGVWCGIEEKDRTKRSLLMKLPELIGEIRNLAGMMGYLRFRDLAIQDLYYWLIEKESIFARKLNLGSIMVE